MSALRAQMLERMRKSVPVIDSSSKASEPPPPASPKAAGAPHDKSIGGVPSAVCRSRGLAEASTVCVGEHGFQSCYWFKGSWRGGCQKARSAEASWLPVAVRRLPIAPVQFLSSP